MSTTTQNPTNATPTIETTPEVAVVGVVFDPRAAAVEIAQKWGWVMFAGVLSVIAGICALMVPGFTTASVAILLGATLFIVGCINMCGVFFHEKGLKLESLLTGVIQVLLAAVMAFYPFSSLAALTATIAAFFLVEGVLRVGFAIANREVKGWGWALFGGIITIALSIIIFRGLPYDAFFVIGILVGVSLISNGFARIAIAWEGRKIAKSATA